MRQRIFYIALILVAFTGCKKHEQPELTEVNTDCDCASEVSADFEILELESLPQFNPIGTDSDTIFHKQNVLFRAKEDNAEYTWYIGNEILNTKEVGRNFSEVWGGQDVTVSLVVRKAPNAICLPNDDGYDSISRTFYVQPYQICDLTSQYVNGTTLMEGTFRVKSAHLLDSFNVTIDYVDEPGAVDKIYIDNYDGMGTNIQSIGRCSARSTYRGLWIQSQGTFYNCFQGEIFYRLNETAIFNLRLCEYVSGGLVYTEYTYIGRKL